MSIDPLATDSAGWASPTDRAPGHDEPPWESLPAPPLGPFDVPRGPRDPAPRRLTTWPAQRTPIHTVLLCTRKVVRRQHGSISMTLRDGNLIVVTSVPLEDAGAVARIQRGQVVEVWGQAHVRRGWPTLQLARLRPARGYAPEAFLRPPLSDPREVGEFLEHIAHDQVSDPGLRRLLARILGDDNLKRAWRRAPCDVTGVYSYRGAVAEHTRNVAMLAIESATLHPRLDRSVLVTSALVHDLGLVVAVQKGCPGERRLGEHALASVVRDYAHGARVDPDRLAAVARCVRATFTQRSVVPDPGADARVLRAADRLDMVAAEGRMMNGLVRHCGG